MRRLIVVFFAALNCMVSGMTSSASPKKATVSPLVTFQPPEEARAWRTVNDDVMDGRSLGGCVVEGGQLVFTGLINTNG